MVNLAIIGLGRWGRVLVDAVQGKTDLVQFTNAVTRTPSKVEDYCKANSITLTSDYSTILSDPKIDGVVLATPHSQHEQQIIDAVRARKHVFCEKPPGRTAAEVRDVISIENQNPGSVLMYGFNHRFHHSVRDALKIVEEGSLGAVVNMRGVYGKSQIKTFNLDGYTSLLKKILFTKYKK